MRGGMGARSEGAAGQQPAADGAMPGAAGAQFDCLVVDHCPLGVVLLDAERRVARVNSRFTVLTGITSAEILGTDLETFNRRLGALSAEEAPYAACGLAPAACSRAQSGCGACGCEFVLAASGRRLHLTYGEIPGAAGVLFFTDISREAALDRLKSEFLVTAAHELRTPMTTIHGVAEMLLTADLDEAAGNQLLRSLYRQSRHLTVVLDDLLDLAKLEGRRGAPLPGRRLNLGETVLRACAGFVAERDTRRPVARIESNGAVIKGDEERLVKAIRQLLSNAFQYSFGRDEVTVVLRDAGAGWYEVAVADHGVGMNSAERQLACERFWRADKNGTIPGTGLGLSLVREIVHLHGGQLTIDSEPGQGTTVRMAFPAAGAAGAM